MDDLTAGRFLKQIKKVHNFFIILTTDLKLTISKPMKKNVVTCHMFIFVKLKNSF